MKSADYTALEYLYAAFAIGMLVLFVASFYFDEQRVHARKLRRNRADLRAALVNRRGARR